MRVVPYIVMTIGTLGCVCYKNIGNYSAVRYNHSMIEILEKTLTGYKYIDLFAGIGGFHLALSSLGAECVYANEWDTFAQNVYKENFGIEPEGDITKVDENKSNPLENLSAANLGY